MRIGIAGAVDQRERDRDPPAPFFACTCAVSALGYDRGRRVANPVQPHDDERTCSRARDAHFGSTMCSRGVVLDNEDRESRLSALSPTRAGDTYRHESLKHCTFKGFLI